MKEKNESRMTLRPLPRAPGRVELVLPEMGRAAGGAVWGGRAGVRFRHVKSEMMIAYSTGIAGGTWVRSSGGRSQPEKSTGKLSEGK